MSTSNSNEFWEKEDGYPVINNDAATLKEEEYKKNARSFGIVFIACLIVIITGIVFTILYTKWTDKVTEYRLRNVDFTVNTYQSEDWVPVNTCKIKVSDAFTLYDSETEIWLPDNKKIIGLRVDIKNEEYDGGGINYPYLNYGDDYYSIPVFDMNTREFIEKAGYKQEEILSSYYAGYYANESGYYFFLVDREADTFSFIVDETATEKNRIEIIKVRNIIDLNINEEEGKNNG